MASVSVPWKRIQGILGDATRGIGDKQTVTVKRPSSSNAITDEPWEGPGEPTSSDTFSSIPAVVATEEQKERDDSGAAVSVQTIKAIIAGGDLSVTPQVGWTVADDRTSTTYSVKKVNKIQPGRDVLVYIVEGSR